MLLQSVIIK